MEPLFYFEFQFFIHKVSQIFYVLRSFFLYSVCTNGKLAESFTHGVSPPRSSEHQEDYIIRHHEV